MEQPRQNTSSLLLFPLIFAVLFLTHAPLLRLPYFWDEAGYFVPAAYDLFRTGDLIPYTTLSNAHPPLVMIWLAAWWKLSNFAPAVSRVAMLVVASFGMLGVFRLGERVANTRVAVLTVVLTALYPTVFAQSSMAQLDIAAFALTVWAAYFYITRRMGWTLLFSALACLAKETAVAVPLTFFAWEIVCRVARKRWPQWAALWGMDPQPLGRAFAYLVALVPLALWYAYHAHVTGHILGNPEYLRYNLGATVTPLRVLIAFFMRVWHVTGYMNLFVLTAATVIAMRMPPLRDNGQERPRIALKYQAVFGCLVLAHVVEFSVLGGAPLARYLVPVIPLVILLCASTLVRRVPQWPIWSAAVAIAFVAALLVNPPWRIAPEDNLAYSDFVRMHKSAAVYVEQHYGDDRILTAWPASDELNRPFLGYVKEPLTIVRVENFTLAQMLRAKQQRESYDVVVAFNTKYEPPRNIFNRFAWWNRIQERYFDYHSDMRPEEIAQMLEGQIAWQRSSGGQWVAVIELYKIRNARLNPTRK